MKETNLSLSLLALGVPGLGGSLLALYLRGTEHVLQVLTLGAMSISGPGMFLAGFYLLLGTRTLLRKAAVAKGCVSDIYEAHGMRNEISASERRSRKWDLGGEQVILCHTGRVLRS